MIRVSLKRSDAQAPEFPCVHRCLRLAGEVVPFGQVDFLTIEKLLYTFSAGKRCPYTIWLSA